MICGYSQTIDNERLSLGRFVQRMYENSPFEGVQVMNTGKNQYVVVVVVLNQADYRTVFAMNRVASVKANSMVSRYLNGSKVSAKTIINLTYEADSLAINSSVSEEIREVSTGYIKSVELFNSFKRQGLSVFVFGMELPSKP